MEGLCKLKTSFTSSGLEPESFWLVAKFLDHYATSCSYATLNKKISTSNELCLKMDKNEE
jgi:hypothetical protein